MEKVIIENRSNQDMEECLLMVKSVISAGRISNNRKQYSYATSFNNGCSVFTDLNRRSDRFVICGDTGPEGPTG